MIKKEVFIVCDICGTRFSRALSTAAETRALAAERGWKTERIRKGRRRHRRDICPNGFSAHHRPTIGR